MKKILKKGFTLVELLAVLVVLVVIVLIAVNVVNSRVKEAKKNSVEVNANNYVKAVNGVAALSQNIGEDMEKGTYQVRDLNKTDIKISGDKPRRGYLILSNYEVTYGCLSYDDYSAVIINGTTKNVDKLSCNSNSFYAEFNSDNYDSQSFIAVADGYYKLEVWGAQGGDYSTTLVGGYGGYSTGIVHLNAKDKLYVTVGRQGDSYEGYSPTHYYGGYNGGGDSTQINGGVNPMAGGGATHIAFKSGELEYLEDYKGDFDSTNNVYRSNIILIVAGGGAGAYGYGSYKGKSGGGYIGGYLNYSSLAGTQTSGAYFGKASDYYTSYDMSTNHAGGGGGFFGGKAYWDGEAGGGSGYIASPKLSNGSMYCYDCTESTNDLTKTTSTTCKESEPTENCAKIGNGYAKITYLHS